MHVGDFAYGVYIDRCITMDFLVKYSILCLFVSFPQKRNGIVFSSGVNYIHSGGNIQSE